jgi:hypothetical protein
VEEKHILVSYLIKFQIFYKKKPDRRKAKMKHAAAEFFPLGRSDVDS